jgi:hypothetical protein
LADAWPTFSPGPTLTDGVGFFMPLVTTIKTA